MFSPNAKVEVAVVERLMKLEPLLPRAKREPGVEEEMPTLPAAPTVK